MDIWSQFFSILGASIFVISIVPYFYDLYKNRIIPRPLSWFGWAVLTGVSFLSQIYEGGFQISMLITLCSTVSTLSIAFYSLFKRRYIIEFLDWVFVFFGFCSIILFLVTKDAFLTTVFAVTADLFMGIPVIINAYQNPKNESLVGWTLGTVGIFFSLGSLFTESNLVLFFYPVYLFVFNITMVLLCFRRYRKN